MVSNQQMCWTEVGRSLYRAQDAGLKENAYLSRTGHSKNGTGRRRTRAVQVPVSTLSLLRGKLFVHHVQVRMLDVRVAAAQRALAQDGSAGRILAHLDMGRRRLDLGELLGLGRFVERGHR